MAEIPNLLIEASAGTGKTQRLAERLIALVGKGRIAPHEIVALTFSRAAAGEIFQRFVSLLAARAETSAEDASLLRQVIDTQHLSQIGTLDSFLVRIARTFPLELGLEGRVGILDDYRAAQEKTRTAFTILRRTDAATRRAFAEAFALAMGGEDVRSFAESYRKFIGNWHECVCSWNTPEAWGNPAAIWGKAPDWLGTDEADLARLADALEGLCPHEMWSEFANWVRGFRGEFGALKGFGKKFFELDREALFGHATIDITYRRAYSFGGVQAQAIRNAVLGVCGYVVRKRLAYARGIFALTSAYEAVYAAHVRSRGRLVFADVPRMLADMPDNVRLALEYRLDAKIRAWALDEFQDTSREQWRAIGPLVEEAKQSDGAKSVFIVGDRKQAIYGWRNGDIGIFLNERNDSRAYARDELTKTYRSAPAVVEAVNRIFVRGRLRTEFPNWEATEHVAAHADQCGFVQAVEASGRFPKHFFEPVLRALRAVDPVRRGLSAAILVRSNTLGEAIAAYLKQNGVSGVVWEGQSEILDTPALEPFLDLVRLADHPGYGQAYRHFASTPLAAALYPDGVPAAGEVSRLAAQAFTTKGLVRAFREMRALLPADPAEAWSVFTESRFTDMLHAAAEFELVRDPGTRLSDFADFLSSKKRRNVAEPGKIRIMTIHRSKGLGFDYVILPLYEKNALDTDGETPICYAEPGWVLPVVDARAARYVSGIAEAHAMRHARLVEESLCTYYVAMTRAKRAMTIVCLPATKGGSNRYMSDFVREAITEPIGRPDWYEEVLRERAASRSAPAEKPCATETSHAPTRGRRTDILRRLPSLALRAGMPAGDFFSSENPRRAARGRGTELHARFEAIEWIDPAAPTDEMERTILANGWHDAFVKSPNVTALWRERGYEIFVGSKWESGQFDRVVFTDTGGERAATVYDFKTNRVHAKESPEDFARRMRETYAGQMASYRAAVASLTGIAPAHVKTILLLYGTGRQVEVEHGST